MLKIQKALKIISANMFKTNLYTAALIKGLLYLGIPLKSQVSIVITPE